MKNILTNGKKNSIIKQYQKGATGAELSLKFMVSVSTIFNVLRDANITIRPRGRRPVTAS